MKSVWQEVVKWMQDLESRLPHAWPPELPPETTEDFWWHAQRAELQTRESVDDLLRALVDGEERRVSRLQNWMIQRRIEWAGQLLVGLASKFPFPEQDSPTLLRFLLIESWERDGQHGFHKHAARDGAPPADNR